MWSGALVETLAAHDPACGVTRAQLAPFLRAGFPWHTPELPHLDRCVPDDWWARLQEVLRAAYEAVGLSAATAEVLARRARECYLDPSGWTVYADTRAVLATLATQGWRHVLLSNHVPELPAPAHTAGRPARQSGWQPGIHPGLDRPGPPGGVAKPPASGGRRSALAVRPLEPGGGATDRRGDRRHDRGAGGAGAPPRRLGGPAARAPLAPRSGPPTGPGDPPLRRARLRPAQSERRLLG